MHLLMGVNDLSKLLIFYSFEVNKFIIKIKLFRNSSVTISGAAPKPLVAYSDTKFTQCPMP